jgi:hypothetical protein
MQSKHMQENSGGCRTIIYRGSRGSYDKIKQDGEKLVLHSFQFCINTRYKFKK